MVALAAALSGCHGMEQGTYDFKVVSVQSDPCHLAPADGGLWSAEVQVYGNQVAMTYTVNGLGLPLVGQYSQTQTGNPAGVDPFSGAPDAFLADGEASAGVVAQVNLDGGVSCAGSTLTTDMDASQTSDTEFQAEMTITYDLEAAPPNPASCPSSCALVALVDATRVGP